MPRGLKISRPGVNVGTATTLDLVYTSELDSLKIFQNGSGTITVPAISGPTPGSASGTVSHNLGYHPVFLVFTSNLWRGTDTSKLSPYGFKSIGAPSPSGSHYSVGTNNLIITVYNGDTVARDVIFKYHIYHNRIR